MNPHPIRCRCGKFEAEVLHPERGTRAVCYCKDCQAFAHFLGLPHGMLDPMGGTEIVAVRPRDVVLIKGAEHLVCMSLTPRGTLRWFTACCRTPVGNTPRNIKLSHAGLVHTALEGRGADPAESFGPVSMVVNRQSARGAPPSTPGPTFIYALLRYLGALLWSRVSGEYKSNPFFDTATGRPRAPPRVLSKGELEQLKSAL